MDQKNWIKNILGLVLGHTALQSILSGFTGKIGEKVIEEVSQKLPMFLGLSLQDERVWAQLWMQLESEQQKYLTDFLENCEDYERNNFRYVVIGIPKEEVSRVITGTGKFQKTTVTYKNGAVDFLKMLADVIKNSNAKEAKRQCLVGGIIVKDPFFQVVIAKWKNGVDWFKNIGLVKARQYILDQFKVTSFSEITLEVIMKKAEQFDKELASKIPVIEYPGFFKGVFGFNLKGIKNTFKEWREKC